MYIYIYTVYIYIYITAKKSFLFKHLDSFKPTWALALKDLLSDGLP